VFAFNIHNTKCLQSKAKNKRRKYNKNTKGVPDIIADPSIKNIKNNGENNRSILKSIKLSGSTLPFNTIPFWLSI
jgi:hypothetical protein